MERGNTRDKKTFDTNMRLKKLLPFFLIFVQVTALMFLWSPLKKSVRKKFYSQKKIYDKNIAPFACLAAHLHLQTKKEKRKKIHTLVAHRMFQNKKTKRTKNFLKILLTYL